MSFADTIIALSTPPGLSGIAVLRLSGDACLEVVQSFLNNNNPVPRKMTYGQFWDKAHQKQIDSLCYVYLPGPTTATAEDMLEIFPHGNPYIIRKILDCILELPQMRLAQKGEFVQRGYENGKMDLLQVEATASLLSASNDVSLQNANRILKGELAEPLKDLKNKLNYISTKLELDVDFSEEEADPAYEEWEPVLEETAKSIENILNTWERGKRLFQEPRVVIWGAPNAGKSSLINAILNENRVMVSEQPGTTRDYIEIPLQLQSGKVWLVDTAGVANQAVDMLDSKAMEFTRAALEKADLLVYLQDGSLREKISTDTLKDLSLEKDNLQTKTIVVHTKADLPNFKTDPDGLALSSLTGEGVLELLELINQYFFKDSNPSEELFIVNERQYHCLKKALANAQAALENIKAQPAVEILAFEIRECRNQLAELIGEYSSEEILKNIFSEFCIGK